MDNMGGKTLIVYGHNYCGQARALQKSLVQHHIEHEWRDVLEGDTRFQDELKQLAWGNLSVPTVIFPDGRVMVEPLLDEVLKRLGLYQPNLVARLLGRV